MEYRRHKGKIQIFQGPHTAAILLKEQDFCIRALPLKAHQITSKAALESSKGIKRGLYIRLETWLGTEQL